MSVSARKKAERIKRMKEEAKLRQRMRELSQVKKPREVKRGDYSFPDPVGYRESTHASIASVSTGAGVAPATAKKEYTGTYVKGIMESHKSNLLPVVDDEHIVAITKMRRN